MVPKKLVHRIKPKQSNVVGKTAPAGASNSLVVTSDQGGLYALPSPAREIPAAVPIAMPPPQAVPVANGDINATIPQPPGPMVGLLQPVQPSRVHRLQSPRQQQREKTSVVSGPRETTVAEGHAQTGEWQVEEFRHQLQNYLEVCDAVATDQWLPSDAIDVLHVMARSLGLEVVSMVLLDPESAGSLGPVISRGYRNPPGDSIRSCWQQAVNAEGRGISWEKLMAVSSEKDNALAAWLSKESLHSYGYVPIRDHHLVHGFLLIGAHDKKPASPLASSLLELVGGRIGLTLALRTTDGGDWPSTVLDAIGGIRDQFSLIMGCFDMLRETPGVASGEGRDLLAQCGQALDESTRLLEQLTATAAAGKKPRRK